MVSPQNSDIAPNGFVRWLDVMGLTNKQAAGVLGKTIRSIEYYVAGAIKPQQETRLLMSALAEGYEPRPWPVD